MITSGSIPVPDTHVLGLVKARRKHLGKIHLAKLIIIPLFFLFLFPLTLFHSGVLLMDHFYMVNLLPQKNAEIQRSKLVCFWTELIGHLHRGSRLTVRSFIWTMQ